MSGVTFREYLRRRELGLQQPVGFQDSLRLKLYYNIQPVDSFTASAATGPSHGAVFNLQFSPDGRTLVAACEKQTVLVLDSVSRKQVLALREAHSDCVNGVTFLDDRCFFSFSDDTTVALWDLRTPREPLCRLRGHSSWVKNVEVLPSKGLVLSSGFDCKIVCWDINKLVEDSCPHTTLLKANDLMRTKLSPDGSKLIVSSSSGYLMVVHDLDVGKLPEDLKLFKPSLYRLMQETLIMIPELAKYTNRFKRDCYRNRIELISDFPRDDEATSISSLEVHPKGWCALSRNTSAHQDSEWTCLHDIQELPSKNCNNDDEDILIAGRNAAYSRERIEADLMENSSNTGVDSSQTSFLRIHKNKRRLLYFCEESNVGQGFIKEQAFSPDGRLVSSPFGFGVRLLAFSPECDDPWGNNDPVYAPTGSKCLYEVRTNICHGNVVACTKFSPVEPLLVSGCIQGKIAWHQPRL
ncbi:DDB1- and CUL4-associated factor 10 homolog isoform X2 [Neocloeon triangulifer]|uniref:DDB1- and CUL4-associated factor 10 homolog isoform X2 n=1 Tax=Neocloeon triangulifer TaxID=2078957 RepID=UPI00286F32BE|nr:DDB1- and CUL4-associated factor 10 homolog isoform X2 [Neocloeon triangulifer]